VAELSPEQSKEAGKGANISAALWSSYPGEGLPLVSWLLLSIANTEPGLFLAANSRANVDGNMAISPRKPQDFGVRSLQRCGSWWGGLYLRGARINSPLFAGDEKSLAGTAGELFRSTWVSVERTPAKGGSARTVDCVRGAPLPTFGPLVARPFRRPPVRRHRKKGKRSGERKIWKTAAQSPTRSRPRWGASG